MKKSEIHSTLKQDYQVQRSTETFYYPENGIIIKISTHVRVYPYGISDDWYIVIFYNKGNEITDGPFHNILMEKYFKPEMLQW